jgi:2Fe-2S ferredoxin
MIRVCFIFRGQRRTLQLEDDGASLMEAAVQHEVEGIVGECGGSAVCGTCHVYIDENDCARLPSMNDFEDAMLDGTASERRANSRLACQIPVTPALDGLTVHIPESQY